MSFEGIINRGEFFSQYYLDAIVAKDVGDLRKRWDDLESHGKTTARRRLTGLGARYFDLRATVKDAAPEDRTGALRGLNDVVTEALGFTSERRVLTLARSEVDTLEMPVVATASTPTGLLVVVIEAGFATDADELFDDQAATTDGGLTPGLLLQPAHRRQDNLEVVSATAAVGELFACEEPPRYVVVLGGAVVLLAERSKWAEGRFLAVDLEGVLERSDRSRGGEIEMVASLFSSDVLIPDDGTSVFEDLVDRSHKHAVGVSGELRTGLRLSVEILANEVIERLDERAREQKRAQFSRTDVDAKDLTRQSLRWLYRLVVLLFAESRPELGIVPMDDEAYVAGYSLDRLRELCMVDLDTDRARNGTHLHESLERLFSLVNDGYHAEHAEQVLMMTAGAEPDGAAREEYLQFPGLDSSIFGPAATPLFSQVTLRNEAVQQVLRLLMVGAIGTGSNRRSEFISYAQLGINQLGAVYEGLMAYAGFFARTDLYEVAKAGDPKDGTWVISAAEAELYPDDVFVVRIDPVTGARERVHHPQGSFVYRLSGRARERSASYYTPEVLTQVVVRHALSELLGLDQFAPPGGSLGGWTATELLDLTICEPALGSGAFANETINQLAALYLQRRQAELGEQLDPDRYQRELQKVKAHFALNQTYGVDLNATAVELAEVSLWLNCMHPGLKAPWYGSSLRRGNSLIGCRRATWRISDLKNRPWLKEDAGLPLRRPLSEGAIGPDEVHHFLLPGSGWGAVADRKEARQLSPNDVLLIKAWQAAVKRAPHARDTDRLLLLAARVEEMWKRAEVQIRTTRQSLRRHLELYGVEALNATPISRERAERALQAGDGALGRLRALMNAWTGLWFWPLEAEHPPPSWEEWLSAAEAIVGLQVGRRAGELALFESFDDIERESSHGNGLSVSDLAGRYPWLPIAWRAAELAGAWHWELEFAPVFKAGGFSLVVGNPPWVVWSWSNSSALGEVDPLVALGLRDTGVLSEREEGTKELLRRELADHAGIERFCSSESLYPACAGTQLNLYQQFLEYFPLLTSSCGITAFVHPTSHVSDKGSGKLRSATFGRLRRMYGFVNQRRFFEIGNAVPYGVSVLSSRQASPRFLYIGNLVEPSTIALCFADRVGLPAPPQKDESEEWVTSGSSRRIIEVTGEDLSAWSAFFGADGSSSDVGRLLNLHSDVERPLLRKFAEHDHRLGDVFDDAPEGADDEILLRNRIIRKGLDRPSKLADAVLQSPNIGILNPIYQETTERASTHRDYRPFGADGGRLPLLRHLKVNTVGGAETARFQLHYKRWIDPKGERALVPVVLPEETIVLAPISTLRGDVAPNDMVAIAGYLSSIVCDYCARVQGRTNLYWDAIRGMPIGPLGANPIARAVTYRALRLACVTSDFAPLWKAVWSDAFSSEAWTIWEDLGSAPGGGSEWSQDSGLLSPLDRWRAGLEIDALMCIALDLDPDDLLEIIRTQFPVLTKYEASTAFDQDGRAIAKHHQNIDGHQWHLQQSARDDGLPTAWRSVWDLYLAHSSGVEVDWRGLYRPPFLRPQRADLLKVAVHTFKRRILGDL